jgi:hypothetical protein
MTLHAAVDKLVYDPTSHEVFLEILSQLSTNRFIHDPLVESFFQRVLPMVYDHYARHHQLNIAASY